MNETIQLVDITDRKLGTRCCEPGMARLSSEDAQQISADLQLLAHPVRLQILDMLAHHGGKVCVCDLEAAVPVKQPTISHHLKILRQADLIEDERHGLWAYYFIKPKKLTALRRRLSTTLEALT
jgi:ArsR family transcriptional regulator, arsenate/arsenite/antimonite-responsive transcriptional repressor